MNEQLKNKVNQWKKIYGKVFSTTITGETYIYRTLNVGECSKILELIENKKQDEAEDLALGAVLYPENFNLDQVAVDVANKLSGFILDYSHVFSADGANRVIEKANEEVDKLLTLDFFKWKLAILNIFPGYTLSDLDEMNIQEFFNLLVLGERLSKQQLISYNKMPQNIVQEQKLDEGVDTKNVARGDKFLSKGDLDQIAADEATDNLKKHFQFHRNKKR